MKKWKLYHFAIFIVLCLALNYFGRLLATSLNLPLWLDSFGTVLCAYIAGPVCGSMVGLTLNLLHGMTSRVSAIYGLTSVALAVVVGLAAKKNKLETLFGTMTASSLACLAAIAISVPLNILFSGGSTANIWGDGVIDYLREIGCPYLLACGIGQFYIDFMDKTLTLVVLYLALKLAHRVAGQKNEDGGEAEKAVKTAAALVLAILLLAPPATVSAEEDIPANYNDYVQTVYSSKNGLPCGEANDIVQTNDGILWVGTYAGLYRYNGREFRAMNLDSVRNVNCLYVDAEGRLWIGTNDNGFSIAINERIVNVVDESKGLPSNSVRSIIQSSDGYYYIGTTSSMQILMLKSGLKRMNSLWEVNYADDVSADENGHVAAITNDGRLFLLKQGQILSSRMMTNGKESFRACAFTKAGKLLAATTTNHIFTYDISSGGFEDVSIVTCGGIKNIKDLYVLDNGEVFISADNGVGYLDTNGKFHLINTNEFNASIDNMLLDYQGNLWFTSSRLGLLRMAPSAFRDVYTTAGMASKVVNTIVRWQDGYYIGTDKGLDVVDEACVSQVENQLTEKLANVRIRCMTVDSDDHLWICTYGGGLIEVEPDGTEHIYNHQNGSFGNRARLVFQLSDGTILAAGDTGLCFIRDHEILHTIGNQGGLIKSMILSVTEMPDGRILAGTDGDGIAVLEDGEVKRLLTTENGLSSKVILRTIADPKGQGVFIVTSNGLCYMDENEQIRPLKKFPYYNNYDIWARDPDTLFVMSSAGIFVVSRDELLSDAETMEYELLNFRRGLNSALTANSWNYSDRETGDLFLPCDKGVYIINANRYSDGTNSYRLMVSALRLDNAGASILRGGTMMIERDVSKIEIFPEIINYTIQDPYVGYYLEGFDSHWNIMPQSALNSIVYTNLYPGSYTFHLAVFDNTQQNILAERVYDVVKEKEIYDYPWFTVYLILVPMIAVAWFTWFVVRTQVQRTLDLQKRELAVARQQIQMGNETIFAIAKAVDAKDERTSQHSARVSQYSAMIAHELGFPEAECENLRKTALMHDIGKIGIPDAILNKPSRLTDDEYTIMKSHTLRGAEILKDFTLLDHVIEGALYHHERYDGRGYPQGLKGEEIPINARIIGVADAFDAMTANRVYRKQMDFGYVLGELEKGKGSQFDPQMVDVLLKLINEGKINLYKLYGVKPEDMQPKPEETKEEKPKEEPKEDKPNEEKPKEEPKEETPKPEQPKADA